MGVNIMAPKSMLPNLTSRPPAQGREPSLGLTADLHLLRSSMSLTSWLCVGAVLTTILSTVFAYVRLPPYLTAALAAIVLTYRTGHTALITFKLIPNPYLEGAIHKWVSAQIPDTNGDFSATPANEGVAVLHLGAKINHPLGGFAPHAQTLIKHADRMYAVLDTEAKKTSGYLGGQTMSAVDKNNCLEFSFISYWRSIEAIHNFAYSDAHRKGWEWWNSVPKDNMTHLGINHEIYYARPGEWETIYVNHQPTLLLGTHSYKPGDKDVGGTVEDGWVANVLDASRGKLRTSAGRLNRSKEELHGRYNYVPKAQAGVPVDDKHFDGREVQV